MKVYDVKPCANPQCPHKINAQLRRVKFCSQCQIQLQDLKDQFPQAQKRELELLFLGGEFRPRRAVVILNMPLGTFYYHCQQRLIRFRREGRSIFIDSREILRLSFEQDQWLTLNRAAEELGLSWQRLRTLVYKHKSQVSSRRDARGRRLVRARHLVRIKRLHQSLEASLSRRKGEGKRAKSTEALISVTEAAKVLGCHRDMILLRIGAGESFSRLKASKVDGRWYIILDDFADFCQRIIKGEIKTSNRTKAKAREYLDS